ncbi:MAG: iron-containing alcohol dehydrogenase [Hyphomicrobiaceae bacterium]
MALLTYLTTTHFDFGAVQILPKVMSRAGVKRPLITTDKGVVAAGILETVREILGDAAPAAVYDETPGNPTEEATVAALEMYRAADCDGVLGLGGGSAMDLGKGVALLAGSGGELATYDPLTGGNRHVKNVAPVVAVPTTSGTGSEVSIGFVIVLKDGRKIAFGGPRFVPVAAICDPELTLGLPPAITAGTGMDAITHCIECYLSPSVNPLADGVALDGLWRGWHHLERVVADGSDRDARWEMMMASTEGALAFPKGLGAVHAMSHALGRLSKPRLHHGTLNAVLLPTVLRFNEGSAPAEKFNRLRIAMGLAEGADLAAEIERMNRAIGIPVRLSEMGVKEDMIAACIDHALADLAHRTNPRQATAEDYERLYQEVL